MAFHTFHVITLGCKVNQFESAAYVSGFENRGMQLVDAPEEADLILVNTCTVTGKAGAQSRREIRRAARANPQARLVIAGCHVELAAEELQNLDLEAPERLVLVRRDHKEQLISRALGLVREKSRSSEISSRTQPSIDRLTADRFAGRTRAYLRVQDGCNSFCSYCIVPYTRGRSRSLPVPEALCQARSYAAAGHREIVITGIHLGQYGADLADGPDLPGLLEKLCPALPQVRFRLSSIEPLEISSKLLTFISEIGNLMPHLHIPLQSGDDDILKAMNRRYNHQQFQSIIDSCRTRIPEAAIGIDVLVGFPGEDERKFANTLRFLEQLDCTYLHVFPYSKRPGTPAAALPGHLGKDLKNRRVEVLRRLGRLKRTAFNRHHCGEVREVLVEKQRDSGGSLQGFTDNYIPLLIDGDDRLQNQVLRARLKHPEGDAVRATLYERP